MHPNQKRRRKKDNLPGNTQLFSKSITASCYNFRHVYQDIQVPDPQLLHPYQDPAGLSSLDVYNSRKSQTWS
jgi:hypothetical protein